VGDERNTALLKMARIRDFTVTQHPKSTTKLREGAQDLAEKTSGTYNKQNSSKPYLVNTWKLCLVGLP
jgi:hypothetical protein